LTFINFMVVNVELKVRQSLCKSGQNLEGYRKLRLPHFKTIET